jgi:flagellar assembly protein FliH
MSPSARRLAADVPTTPFHWQAAPPSGGGSFRPQPVVFAQAARDPVATADADHEVEARELLLPSVSAERRQALEAEAFAQGLARGIEAGEATMAAELADLTARLTATIADVGALRTGVMRRAERELVHLALVIAERIVRREVGVDPDLLLVMARVAIDRLGEQTGVTLHLHPADCEAVTRARLADMPAVSLLADPALARGSCLIRSEFGVIDAGIDGQIRELSRELIGDGIGEESAHGVGHDR